VADAIRIDVRVRRERVAAPRLRTKNQIFVSLRALSLSMRLTPLAPMYRGLRFFMHAP
jgi:hypothetical protein